MIFFVLFFGGNSSLHKDWNRQVRTTLKRHLRNKKHKRLSEKEVKYFINMFKTMFYDRKDITYYIEDSIDYKKWNSLSTVEKDAFSYEFYDELDLNRVNAQNGGNGKLYTKADKPLAPLKFKIRVKNLNPWLRKVAIKKLPPVMRWQFGKSE